MSADLKVTPRRRVRAVARHGAVTTLARLWEESGRTGRAIRRPRVHLPYLHAVPAVEEARFRQLLDWLAPTHEFVSYSEAVERILNGRIDRPTIAFSFDDGFASNARTAEILEEYGATGCFFVATGFIGVPDVTSARGFFGYSQGIDEPAMTWGDLERLKSRGHEIENHTSSHRQISNLSHQEVVDQIGQAAEDLKARLGGSRHFAWPFGRYSHFSAAAAGEVFAQGHRSCASAERGAHVSDGEIDRERLCLRRDHLVTSWPLIHQQFFLARSAVSATTGSGEWPSGWRVSL